MERLFIITGADGHLGGTLIRLLRRRTADCAASQKQGQKK